MLVGGKPEESIARACNFCVYTGQRREEGGK